MTVQATNVISTVPNYSSGSNMTMDSGCDFESFLSGPKDAVTKAENCESKTVKQIAKTKQHEKNAEPISDSEKAECSDVSSDKNAEGVELAEKLPDEAKETEDVAIVTQENQEQEELVLPSEQLLAEVLSILQEMVVVLQEELQVTEHQLLNAMEELQFQVTDFFDADKVKAVFLQLNEVDATALLTDESLLVDLQQLQNLLEEVVEQCDLYSLLQQEGINPEGFELSMLEEKITEQILNPKPIATEVVADVSIEFESVKRFIQETQSSNMTEATTTLEQLQTVEVKAEENYTGTSEQERSFDAEQQFSQASMFLQKLASVAKNDTTDAVQNITSSFDLIDIATQIIDQVRLQVRPDTTRMQIQLNPENLGKVELEITSKNGELSAKMNVQNDQVKEAVESQMQVLRETLEVQGIKVESIEVTVAEFGFRFQDETNGQAQQQRQNRHSQLNLDDAEEEDFNIPDAAEVMMELNGNSVDYVA